MLKICLLFLGDGQWLKNYRVHVSITTTNDLSSLDYRFKIQLLKITIINKSEWACVGIGKGKWAWVRIISN